MGTINRYMKTTIAELTTRTMGFVNSQCGVDGRMLVKSCTYSGHSGIDHKVYEPMDISTDLQIVGNVLGLGNLGTAGTLAKFALTGLASIAHGTGYLYNNGVGVFSWSTPALIAHNLFSTTHSDTTGAASPVDGDLIIGNVTPIWSKLAISIPAANVRNVLGIDNGELRPSWKTALDGTAPATIAVGGAGTAGTSLIFSHRDHNHPAPPTWTPSAHDQNANTIIIPSGYGTPSYDDMQDLLNNTRSAGRIIGGVITPNGAVNGRIDISEMQGMIFTSNSLGSPLVYFKKAAVANLVIADDLAVSWVYYDYTTNSYLTTTDRSTIHEYDQFTIGRVWRSGNTVEVQSTGHNLYNKDRRSHNRLILKYGNMDHVSGAIISAHATPLRLTCSIGSWYVANAPYTTLAVNTITVMYRTGGGAWTQSGSIMLFSKIFDGGGGNKIYETYQNGTSLSTLTGNHYGVYWIFLCPQGHMNVVLGDASYSNIGLAQASTVPASLPARCVNWSILIGRVIVQKTAAAFYSVESVWLTKFTLSSATDHSSLYNLAWSVSGHTGLTAGTIPMGQLIGLSDSSLLENASGLKLASGKQFFIPATEGAAYDGLFLGETGGTIYAGLQALNTFAGNYLYFVNGRKFAKNTGWADTTSGALPGGMFLVLGNTFNFSSFTTGSITPVERISVNASGYIGFNVVGAVQESPIQYGNRDSNDVIDSPPPIMNLIGDNVDTTPKKMLRLMRKGHVTGNIQVNATADFNLSSWGAGGAGDGYRGRAKLDFNLKNDTAGYDWTETADETILSLYSDGRVALPTDGAILKFGASEEISLTHIHNVGLQLTGRLGIGISPTLSLQVIGTNNTAATGWTTLFLSDAATGHGILTGSYNSIAAIQGSNGSTVEDIIINPVGGKLGIGVTPVCQLDILNNQNSQTICQIKNTTSGTGAAALFFAESSGGNQMAVGAYSATYTDAYLQDKGLLYSGGNAGMVIEQSGNFPIDIFTNSGLTMTLNLSRSGLYRTPEVWHSHFRPFAIGTGGFAIVPHIANSECYLINNGYLNASVEWINLYNQGIAAYRMVESAHMWYSNTSPGAAGTAYSPTLKMQLDGDLLSGVSLSFSGYVECKGSAAQMMIDNNADNGTSGILYLWNSCATPADDEEIGRIQFMCNDSGANSHSLCEIVGRALDITHGTEDGDLTLSTTVNGSYNSVYMKINSGFKFYTGNVFINTMKAGATQGACGAAATELWKTSGHATLPDNVVMMGV